MPCGALGSGNLRQVFNAREERKDGGALIIIWWSERTDSEGARSDDWIG